MVCVAIAGGTGGLGRTLVDEFAKGGQHTVFVLSRKAELPFEAPSNVHCVAAPYDDVDDLTSMLEAKKINTVISTLSPPMPEAHAAQDNLIRAADKSSTVTRFIPSEWGIEYNQDDKHLPLPWKTFKQQSMAELEKHPDLEYTAVYNGFFLDYFGIPYCESYMPPEHPYVDIGAGIAAIPGSGNDKVAFTYTKDVAKFVRKMVESEDPWPTKSLIVGDTVTFNEIVHIVEEARGRKLDVVHDSLENLRAGKITEIPAYVPFYDIYPREMMLEMMAAFGVSMIMGVFEFDGELNRKYPDIRTTKVRDFIKTSWEGH